MTPVSGSRSSATMSHSKEKRFGHIRGHPPGAVFDTRHALFEAGVHGQTQAGIFGNTEEGAYSICISGGYEDDEDLGENITYVGSGGRDDSDHQIKNQSMNDPPNRALLISSLTKRPVRVIRGADKGSYFAPASGYRYDGLYIVDSAKKKLGKEGKFQMCFFKLRRLKEEGNNHLLPRRKLDQKGLIKKRRYAQKGIIPP